MEKASAVILAFTPEPQRICASAARISSTKGTATEIYESTDKSSIGPLLENAVVSGDETITEHAVFTIAFENVSAFFEQFLISFRLASYTIKSKRYVDSSGMGGLVPEFRMKDGSPASAKMKEQFESLSEELFEDYNRLLELDIPREDACFVLPYCFRSQIYCTVNARELMHILNASLHGRGASYPEIRRIGENLLAQAREILPDLFDTLETVEKGVEESESRLAQLMAGRYGLTRRGDGEGSIVELLTHSAEPDLLVAVAAIIRHTGCSSADALEMLQVDDEMTREVIRIIASDKRKRELEQISVTFRLNDMSLSCLAHLTRHRMQSLVVPSFTEFGKSRTCVMPESVSENDVAEKIYTDCFEKSMALYNAFLDAGVMAEDLVYLYLSGNVVDVVTTMNGRELYHVLKRHGSDRAPWEIRNYAMEMFSAVRGISPLLFGEEGLGGIAGGMCPEGETRYGK